MDAVGEEMGRWGLAFRGGALVRPLPRRGRPFPVSGFRSGIGSLQETRADHSGPPGLTSPTTGFQRGTS